VAVIAARSKSDATEFLLRGRKSSVEVAEKAFAGVTVNQNKG